MVKRMNDRTYVECKRLIEEKHRKICEVDDVSWGEMQDIYGKVRRIMERGGEAALSEQEILERIKDPVVGLYAAGDKMRVWFDMVKTVQNICTDDDDNLFRCPDVVTEPSRLLHIYQDTMLLAVTLLVMHEGLYKSSIDLLYDGTGHGKCSETKTACRIDYLATHNGIDIRDAMHRPLRNDIAHMSFRITSEGGIEGKDRPYTRKGLIDAYVIARDALWPLYHAITFWFEYNHGPIRLFDDAFFETKFGRAVMQQALDKMMQENQTVMAWNGIVEDARRRLASGRPTS